MIYTPTVKMDTVIFLRIISKTRENLAEGTTKLKMVLSFDQFGQYRSI